MPRVSCVGVHLALGKTTDCLLTSLFPKASFSAVLHELRSNLKAYSLEEHKKPSEKQIESLNLHASVKN